MILDRMVLEQALGNSTLQLTEETYSKMEKYAALLLEWNEKINLTSITEPREVTIKHFLDSLTLFDTGYVSSEDRLIDVGTGAGFPGLPMRIFEEGLSVTLVDSLKKRVNFLQEVSENLQLNVECIHARAEELGKKPEYREKFNVATARAVGKLAVLAEYCLPFVKVGGVFLAMKGPDVEKETEHAEKAVVLLGGEVEKIHKMSLPDDYQRSIVVIRKKRATKPSYPRPSAKISKGALG